jgi:hypothetical protein
MSRVDVSITDDMDDETSAESKYQHEDPDPEVQADEEPLKLVIMLTTLHDD